MPKRITCILTTLLSFSLISLTFNHVHAATLFNDSFEGNYNNWDSYELWSIVGTAHTGTSSAKIIGSTSGDTILQKSFSTLGYENIVLSFWYKIQSSLENTDHVRAEFSTDSNTWTTLTDYTTLAAGNWIQSTFNLPADIYDNSNFQFRFLANLSSSSDDFRLDDVALFGDPIPTPTLTPLPTATPSPTPEPTLTPTPTIIPSPTPVPTLTPTLEPTPTSGNLRPTLKPTPTPFVGTCLQNRFGRFHFRLLPFSNRIRRVLGLKEIIHAARLSCRQHNH